MELVHQRDWNFGAGMQLDLLRSILLINTTLVALLVKKLEKHTQIVKINESENLLHYI